MGVGTVRGWIGRDPYAMTYRKPESPRTSAIIDLADRDGNVMSPTPRMTRTAVTAAANRVARAAGTPGAEAPAGAGATVADLIGTHAGQAWPAFVADRILTWASGYFDEGARARRSPWYGATPYAAWRGEAELDRTPELLGLNGFRGIARTLPRDADTLLLHAAHELRLNGECFDGYLQHLCAAVAPWASYARCHGSSPGAGARRDAFGRELLAIRAAWDLALLDAFGARRPGLARQLGQALSRPLQARASGTHGADIELRERRSA